MADDLAAHIASLLSQDKSAAFEPEIFDQMVLAYLDPNGRTWMQILGVLREFKVRLQYEPRVKRRALELQGIPSIGTDTVDTSGIVTKVWKDIPGIHSEAAVPPGFGFEGKGSAVFRKEIKISEGTPIEKQTAVSLEPIVIRRRILHETKGTFFLELVWRYGKYWRSGVYDRDHVFNTRGLITTARDGVPVAQNNAMEMVAYLQAYEHHNVHLLAHGFATGSMGWQGEPGDPTAHGYLCGREQLGGNGKVLELHTVGEGDDQIVDSLSKAGTFEGWRSAINEASRWPAVRIALYAALASPLLAIVRAPNAIVEWVGRTSRGKTTAMRVAQSCLRSSMYSLETWNNTIVGFEGHASLCCDFPIFLDDTKTVVDAGRAPLLAKMIYQFVAGRGRMRGGKEGGMRASTTWRSVLMSTGEVPSSDLAKAEGAATRVLSFWTTPTGETSPETGQKIDQILLKLDQNHGHALPMMVKWLCENRDKWDDLRRVYEFSASRVRREFTSPAASRLAQVIALLELAAGVATEMANILPWKFTPLLDDPEIRKLLSASLHHATTASDEAKEAWDFVISYADARPSHWLEPGSEGNKSAEPGSGWLGWRDEEYLAWNPAQLRRVLKEGGYNEGVLRALRDAGAVDAPQGGFVKQIRIGGPDKSGHKAPRRVVQMALVVEGWTEDLADDPPTTEKS